MKKLFLLTKTLLVAVMLCVGANAWAVNNDDYGIDLDTYDKTTYDFANMTKGSLTINTTADPFSAWSSRENKSVSVYPCTTTGMTGIALQDVSGDGWKLYGGGLCTNTRIYAAAVTGLKNGNIVVFVYTMPGKVMFGNTASETGPYTLNDEVTVTAQTTLYDGTYYRKATMTGDGVIGFNMNKWSSSSNAGFIKQIHVYKVKGVCAEPTYQITGANGNARTFTLSCETAESTIYYSTSELASATGGLEYTGAVETEATKIWAYAKTSSSTSGVINFNTGAGSYEQVNGATFANAYYDVASSKWCVKVKEDQSSVIGQPTVTLKYYTTDPESQTDCTAGNFITGFDFGATVYVEASADNYSSKTTSYTFPSSLAVGDRVATWTDTFTSGESLTFGASETMGNVTCAPITAIGDAALSGNFGLNGNNNWSSTVNGITTGNNYYTGAKNLSTTGLLKIVVNEATFLNDGITGRKNASLNYTEKNTDGTYSMYFNVSGSSVCFNGKGGQTILSVSFMNSVSATIGSTGWTTFASPYALDLSSMTASTGVVAAYYASTVNASTVTMTSTTATVAAGTGIMLKGTADATITIPVAASGDAISGNKLVGCTSETVLSANENYYVLVNNDGAEFQRLDVNGATIPAGKAYLNTGASSARSLRIVFAGDITGISEAAQATEAAEKDGKFVENGQLVIKKNGKKFNAAGAQMK